MTQTSNYFKEKLAHSDLMLAPLAGVTDAAFRRICSEQGAYLMVSEMVSAAGLHYSSKNTVELIKLFEGEKNTGIQLFGSCPEMFSEAAEKYINKSEFAFIDINMGCPVKKVFSGGDGSALMADTLLAARIVEELKKYTDKPVSVKTRLGIDREHVNIVEFSQALIESGADMITIHGRTRDMMFSGKASYELIAKVKEVSSVPVVANGDISDYTSYVKVKNETGCDGFMIGRASMGNPFVFSSILSQKQGKFIDPPTVHTRLAAARRQFGYMLEYKPEHIALNEFKKHLAWYTKGIAGGASLRSNVMSAGRKEEVFELIDSFMEKSDICIL